MNETLIDNHNNTVKDHELVYFLGDFSFGDAKGTQQIIQRLNGEKHLILGNHDGVIESNPKRFIGNNLFRTIQHYKEIRVEKQKIILFHFPIKSWNGMHANSYHCHGHVHRNLNPVGKSVDVGVDADFVNGRKYFPIHFDELKSFMDKQESQFMDHHSSL